VAQAEAEIREIQARLEALSELQAEGAWGGKGVPPLTGVSEEEMAQEIERLKGELQHARRGQGGNSDD
jgi:hypothetical protein